MVIVQGQSHLLHIVQAVNAIGSFPNFLYRRHQQGHEHADDRYHHQ
jgi:hypothetical protein